jgi:uncharacterized protein YhbP (UPF0306 family)
MDEKITRFILNQTCAGICCVDETGSPYCFSCFYAFNSDQGLLFFKSPSSARHSSILTNNPLAAGTIQPDKLNKLIVKGIQFEGVLLPENNPACKIAVAAYYRKFPMAFAIPGEIRTIRIHTIKMTDSTIGFGKKIHWKNNPGISQATIGS